MKGFLKEFSIGSFELGEGRAPLLISETACAHDGSVDEAKHLADASADAGADLIQLQVFRTDQQVPPSHSLRELLGRIELSDQEWADVFQHARNTGVPVMAFVYDLPSLRVVLDQEVVALKLNSADLLNRPLLEACAESGLPVFLGTGASTFDEISQSLGCLSANGSDKVILMHGVQDFPTNLGDARIDRVRILREVFGLPSGYGDHTDGDDPASRSIDLVALGLGAYALEKHITLDRSAGKPDFQAALEPDDWKAWASTVRQAASALSSSPPVDLSDADKRYRVFQKKFAVASRPIKSGDQLDDTSVRFLRLEEEGHISALAFDEMGQVMATRDLDAWEMIRHADLAPAEGDSQG